MSLSHLLGMQQRRPHLRDLLLGLCNRRPSVTRVGSGLARGRTPAPLRGLVRRRRSLLQHREDAGVRVARALRKGRGGQARVVQVGGP